jgi:autotransporter-associated beta strand protein
MAFFSWSRWFRSLLRPQVKPIHKRSSKARNARLNLEHLETRLAPAQFVWTGFAGDGKWGTGNNWSGHVAPSPADGLDDLIFQPGAGTTTLTNNIGSSASPLRINSISFSGNNFTFAIGSQPIILGTTSSSSGTTGTITVNNGLTEAINLAMTLGGNGSGQQTFNVGTGATLTIGGQLSGTAGAGWTKTGTGTMVLSGTNSNFTGAFTLKAGVTLLQNGAALGAGTSVNNTVTVQSGAQMQLYSGNSGGFTVPNKLLLNGVGLASTGPNSGAVLNVAGYNTWGGPVEMDSDSTIGAAAQTAVIANGSETGTTVTITTTAAHNFAVGQQVVISNVASAGWDGIYTITGVTTTGFTFTAPANLPGFLPFINVLPMATVESTLTVKGVLSDNGSGHNLTKEGNGTLDLQSANTYRGTTTINNGVLTIENGQALGTGPGFKADNSTADAITVNTNFSNGETGTLQIKGPASGTGLTIANKLVILNGTGFAPPGQPGFGAMDNLQGNNTWTGNVILGSPFPSGAAVTIEADTPATAASYYTLTISGVVQDPYLPGNSLSKTGLGILNFTNSNTYTGTTDVFAGILEIQDSQALGQVGKISTTNIHNGASLEIAVDNNPDSVTQTRNSKNVSDPLEIWGPGAPVSLANPALGTLGALYSASGINTYSGTVTINDLPGTGTQVAPIASIGVAADPNPTATANYLTTEYSLTITGGLIGNWPFNFAALTKPVLQKFGAGDLILPNANDQYHGPWEIRQGWVTVEDNDSFGLAPTTVEQADEPTVTIDAGAAVHLYDPSGTGINLRQNFNIAGNGIGSQSTKFSELNQQGAIENIGGVNTITGNILFNASPGPTPTSPPVTQTGIGVEQVFGTSQLSLLGTQYDQPAPTFVKFASGSNAVAGGSASFFSGSTGEDAAVIQTGSTSGTITLDYNMTNFVPRDPFGDTIDVYYGIFGEGGVNIFSTNGVALTGANTIVIPYAPVGGISSTYITIVIDQGTFGSEWTYTANIVPNATAGGGLIKDGSGLLDLQGPGTYTGGVDIRQGVLLAQNNTALGVASVTPTTTPTVGANPVVVEPGAALALANSTAYNNGGIEGGIQIAGQHLVIGSKNGNDATLQTVTITGSLAGTAPGVPTGNFTLSFNGFTTGQLSTTVPASGGSGATGSLQNALNALPSVVGVGGSVTVKQTGDVYTITFGGSLAGKVQPRIQVVSVSAGTNVAIGTGIGNMSLGNVGAAQGAPVAPFSIWGSAASEWNSNITLFNSNAFLAGLTQVNLAPYGKVGSNTIIPTDDQWQGPITLNVSAPIDVPPTARLILSGNIDDATNPNAAGSDIVKVGAGELFLSGASTYHGTTYVGSSGNPTAAGFDPDGVNELFTNGQTIPGGVMTVANSQALGTAGSPTVQTVTLTGATVKVTQFSLQFNGSTTDPILYTGVAATDVQAVANALNGLPSIGATAGTNPGGLVTVSSSSPGVFTVTFLGTFVGFNQPTMLPLINSGPGSIAAVTTTPGTGGVVVQNGSALQLQGTITVAGKTLQMGGTGYDSGGAALASPNWVPAGPAQITNGPTINGKNAPTSGRVTGIASDPFDAHIIYISTAGGGAWKSENSGTTWYPIFDNSASEFSGAIAVAPSNSQTIYLGTGESDGSIDSYAGTGVYRSTDGGHTWTQLTNAANGNNPLAGLAVSKIAVDPGDPSVIYVATSDLVTNAVSVPGKVGLYRFDGSNWVNLTNVPSVTRENTVGKTQASPPKDPGPNDNYLYGFPQQNVTWSDVSVVGTGSSSVLFAALGTPGAMPGVAGANGIYHANPAYKQPPIGVDPNGVYFSLNPTSTNTPDWWLGDGIVDGETSAVDFPQVTNAGNIKLSAVITNNPFAAQGFGLQPDIFHWQEIAVYAAYESAVPATAGNLVDVQEGTVVAAKGNFFPGPVNPPPNKLEAFLWATVKPNIPAPVDTQGNYDMSVFAAGTFIPTYGNYNPTGAIAYVGTQNNLQWTSNSGGAWNDITVDANSAAPAVDFHALTGAGPDAVLAGTDGGIWSLNTTPDSTTGLPADLWVDLNTNLADNLVTSVGGSTINAGTLVAGTQGAGTDLFTGGSAWTMTTAGVGASPLASIFPYGARVVVNPDNPLNMFAFVTSTEMAVPDGILRPNPLTPSGLPLVGTVVPYSLLMESNDGGQSWQTVTTPPYFPYNLPAGIGGYQSFTEAFAQDPTIAFDQANPNRIMVPATNTLNQSFVSGVGPLFGPNGHEKLFNIPLLESLDGGATFHFLNTPSFFSTERVALATFQGPFLADSVFPHVGDAGANNDVPGTFYVVDDGFGTADIYITRDYGQTWDIRTSNLPPALTTLSTNESLSSSPISDLVVDPSNSNVVYVVNSGPSGMGIGRVFQSTDGGLSWNVIGGMTGTDGLPDVPAWKLVIDPRSGSLYVGTDQGVYTLSSAASSTWTLVGTGLPQVQVKDLFLDSTTNTLVAGTYGRGVWSVPLSSTQVNAGAVITLSGSAQWAGPIVLTGATTISALGSQTLANDLSAAQLSITGTISDYSGTNGNALTVGTGTGDGTVIFSGANTYTGTTEVAHGVLRTNNLSALGSTVAGTQVDDGAALQLQSSVDAEPLTLFGNGPTAFDGHNTGALESTANDNQYDGPITLASSEVTIGVASGSTLTIKGAISGNGNLIKELTGTLALDESPGAPNIYTGSTFVYQGALQIETAFALPGNSTTTVLDGAQLQLGQVGGTGVTVTGETLDLSGSGINNSGALLNVGGNNTWAGPIDLDALPGFSDVTFPTGTVVFGVGRDGNAADPTDILTITGPITETTNLYTGITKIGPDQLILAGSDSYNGGTFIQNGVVTVQNAQALGDPSNDAIQRLTVYDLGIGGSFTLSMTINGQTATSNPIPSGLDGSSMASQVSAELNQILVSLGVTNVSVPAQPPSAIAVITGTTPPAHEVVLSIVFQGAGLAGFNLPQIVALATGATVVQSKVADANAGTEVESGPGGTSVAGLQLDLANSPTGQTVNESILLNGVGTTGKGALENVSGDNVITGQVTLASNSSIGVDAATGTPSSLTIAGDVAGPVTSALSKIGPGTLTLTNANDYLGTTLIQSGILGIQNGAALGGSLTDDVQTITVTGATTGTYQLIFIDSNGNSHTTAAIPAGATALQVAGFLQTVTGTRASQPILNASESGNTVTIVTSAPLGAVLGQAVTISGIGTPGYNGTYLVTGVSGNTFSYTGNFSGLAPDTKGGTASLGNVFVSLDPVGGVYTVTFLGSLAGKPVRPLVLLSSSQGTQVDLAVVTPGGQGNTIVATGATLQLSGGIHVSTEQVVLNGTGVSSNGALESVTGANFWDPNTQTVGADPVPPDSSIVLASNSFIAVDSDVSSSMPGLTIDQSVTESAPGSNFIKMGLGTLLFTGTTSNTYSGLTTVGDGTMLLNKAEQTITSATETGNTVTITTSAVLGVIAGQRVSISGVLTQGYNGTFVVSAVNGNSFSYINPVAGLGTDTAGGIAAAVDIPAGFTVGDGNGLLQSAVGRLEAPAQIAPTATLGVNSDGLFDPNGIAQPIGGLVMTGGSIDLTNSASAIILNGDVAASADSAGNPATIFTNSTFANGLFSLGGSDRNFVINPASVPDGVDMDIQVPITGTNGARLIKGGAGRLELDSDNNVNTLPNAIVVNNGDVQVDGTVGEVSVNGGSVSGRGSVGVIDGSALGTAVSGTINPGDNGSAAPTAILTSDPGVNAEFWGSQTSFWVDLQSATDINGNDNAGAGYDQLIVNGNLDLGGATLTGTAGANIVLGDTFTILKAGGGGVITGKFANPAGIDASNGMPIAYIGGSKFDVNYIQDASNNTIAVQLIRAKQTATIGLTVSTANPSVYGQDVVFTAKVTVDNGVGSAPPGTKVRFRLDANGIAITSASESGTTVTITTAGPHNFTFGQQVVISGIVPGGYDGTQTITSVAGNSFTYTAPAGLGTATLADAFAEQSGSTPLLTVDVLVNAAGLAVFDPASIANLGAPLSVGQHTVDATYLGQTNVINSVSATQVHQTVTQARTTTTLSFDVSNLQYVYGQTVLATAIVAPKLQPALPGEVIPAFPEQVNFVIDGGPASGGLQTTVFLDGSGRAQLPLAGLSVGPHTVAVAYPGDTNFLSSAASTATIQVNKDASSLVLGSSSGATSVFGQPVTFKAIVSVLTPGTASPTGSVSFFDAGSLIGAGTLTLNTSTNNYEATFTTTSLLVGTHSITATYGGTPFVLGSTGKLNGTGVFTVTQNTTTTTLSVSPATWGFGQQIVFTATVAVNPPGGGIPVGQVFFFDDISGAAQQIGQGSINSNGQVILTTTLGVGPHDIFAAYAGTTSFASSTSNKIAQTVMYGSLATVSSSNATITYGDQVTFTASVTGGAGTPTGSIPTGSVTFTDTTFGVVLAANVPLTTIGNAGKASFTTTNALTIGTHSIQVTYTPAPGSPFTGTVSAALVETVRSMTTTSLQTSASPGIVGQPLTITATVTPVAPGAGVPTGLVSFFDTPVAGGTPAFIGQANLNASGQANLTLSSLLRGTHNLTASYPGDKAFAGSATSGAITQMMLYGSATTVRTSAATILFGATVTFTATVGVAKGTPSGSGVPTGTVSFYDNGTFLGQSSLNTANVATLQVPGLGVGIHAITAVYNGNTSFVGSTSAAVNQNVLSQTTTVLTSSSPSALYSQQLTFTAVVTANVAGTPTPAGTVTFRDLTAAVTLGFATVDNTGTATFATTSNLSVGKHTIQATFNPAVGTSVATSSATTVQMVAAASTTTTISSNSSFNGTSYNSVFGESVTLSAVVAVNASPVIGAPLGKVTFKDGNTVLATVALNGGKATFITNVLNAGTHNITAVYVPGSTNFQTSTGALQQIVAQDTTTIQVSSSANPGTVGSFVTITAQVIPDAPGTITPTGTVDFVDPSSGFVYAAAVTLVKGKASFNLTNLQFTTYNIQANYNPPAVNPNYTASSSDTFVETALFGTNTTVSISPTSTTIGQMVTIAATVTPKDPSLAVPTSGNVDFFYTLNGQTTQIGTVSIDGGGSGQAILPIDTLPPGSLKITATYEGDGVAYAGSTASGNVSIFDIPQTMKASITAPTSGVITIATIFTITATLTGTQGGPITVLPPGAQATITILNGTGLSGNLTASFVNGKFVFSGLKVTAGGNYSLQVSYNGIAAPPINFSTGGRLG